MSQYRCEIDYAGRLIDRGSLHGRDLMLSESLAHDIQPARQWRVTKRPFGALPCPTSDGADQRFLRIDQLGLSLGERSSDRSNRWARSLHRLAPQFQDQS